jgi:hypothetical protein
MTPTLTNAQKYSPAYGFEAGVVVEICGHKALFSESDVWLASMKWSVQKHKPPRTGIYFKRVLEKNKKQIWYSLHRIIVGAHKGEFVDHINGNTLDNRRCNLRIVNRNQNKQNTARRSGKSGVLGISIKDGKYRVRVVSPDGIRHHIGYFTEKGEAATALIRAVNLYHGEYSRIKCRGISHASIVGNLIDLPQHFRHSEGQK